MMSIKDYLEKESPKADKEIKKIFPKKLTKKNLEHILGKARYDYDIEAFEKAVSEPIWDLLERGGKRWRPTFLSLCCEAVGGDPKKYKDFLAIPELVHNGTLMVDDVEDDSDQRRGKPCTHKLYGVDVAVNAGNTMYYLPLVLLYRNKHKLKDKIKSEIYDIYCHEMLRLSFGQAMDIYWHRGNKKEVTEKQYLQMCAYKTGTLARMSAKIGAILGGANRDKIWKLGHFASTIGIAFQIQDDILNVCPPKGWGKEVGEDIHEGKRSLMVIHALSKANKKDKAILTKILNSHTRCRKKIKQAIGILEKYGSIEYARKKAKQLVKESWAEVDKILKESKAKNKLREFAEYLIKREI